MIDELEAPIFARLVHIIERTKRERTSLGEADVNILKRSSARLSTVLAVRGFTFNFDEIMPNYSGNDLTIMRIYVDSVAQQALQDRSKWKKALPIIRHAYGMDLTPAAFEWRLDNLMGAMDGTTANDILRSPQDYPLSLINLAQGHATKDAGSKAQPPGDVALKEHWF